MSTQVIRFVVAAALAAAPLASHALGTNEKGCLVGGAVGGLAGHAVSGNRTLLGAAIGCGAGVLVNKERVKRIDAKSQQQKRDQVAARKRQYANRDPYPEAPRYSNETRR